MESTTKDSIVPTDTSPSSSLHQDIEKGGDYAHLSNASIHSFAWEDVSVTVKDRQTGLLKTILRDSRGLVRAGTYAANLWVIQLMW